MPPIQVAVGLTHRGSIMLSVERADKNMFLSQDTIWEDFKFINFFLLYSVKFYPNLCWQVIMLWRAKINGMVKFKKTGT